MNRKELTKTFMMISNWKKFWPAWFKQNIIRQSQLYLFFISTITISFLNNSILSGSRPLDLHYMIKKCRNTINKVTYSMQNRGEHDFSNNYRPWAQTLSYCYRMYHACVSAPTRKCIGWWRLPPAGSRVWAIMRRPAAWSHQDEEQMVHLFTSKHKTLNQSRLNVGPASSTMGQYWAGNGSSLLFAL